MCRRRGRTREGRKNQRVKIAEVEWQESRQHHDFPWTKELMSKMTAYIETVKSVTITDEVQLSMTWEEMMGPFQIAYTCKVHVEENIRRHYEASGPTRHDESANEGLREHFQD